MIVVADATPLLHLARIGRLDLIQQTFGDVLLPRSVWSELVDSDPEARGVHALREAGWLRVMDDPPPLDLGLDAGETAAIALAELLSADLLLIDERRGRAVAQGRGISIIGTMGIIGLARRRGLLEEARPVLDALREGGFWLADDVAEAFLASLGEGQ